VCHPYPYQPRSEWEGLWRLARRGGRGYQLQGSEEGLGREQGRGPGDKWGAGGLGGWVELWIL